MPKLVCSQCETELKPYHNGTLVIETADFGEPKPSPYKVWQADTWKCPGCGIEIVAGFGTNPLRQDHYVKDFPEWLDRQLAEADQIVYDHERPVKHD
jgi:hypothetical protein